MSLIEINFAKPLTASERKQLVKEIEYITSHHLEAPELEKLNSDIEDIIDVKYAEEEANAEYEYEPLREVEDDIKAAMDFNNRYSDAY